MFFPAVSNSVLLKLKIKLWIFSLFSLCKYAVCLFVLISTDLLDLEGKLAQSWAEVLKRLTANQTHENLKLGEGKRLR